MIAKTLEIAKKGDTVGGIVEVIARGVPAGLGEQVFDKLTALLAHAMMSIGAVRKGPRSETVSRGFRVGL